MTISFNQIPNNIRVPGVYAEVTNQLAQSAQSQNTRILVIGQRLSTGTVTAGVPTLITTKEQAITSFGRGSMLANMFDTLFANNPYTEKWAVALDDNGAGAKAVGKVSITGPATAAGTINLYIGGVLVQCAVASGDAATAVATALAAAINAAHDLPVTAAVNGTNAYEVDVTYRHKGLVGNLLPMRLNYRGALGGETTPAGLIIAITQLANGTANPDIATAISALPDEIFNFWLMPYIDATNLIKLENELISRWGPMRMLEGHGFLASPGSVSELSTLGNSRNNEFSGIMDAALSSPTPSYLWAAAVCGQVAFAATNDPARPFNTLELVGVLPENDEDKRNITERNTLLYDGISTHTVSRSGAVRIDRLITTYQFNSAGVPDSSYLDANTPLTLSYLRQSIRARISQKFPRHKLAADGTRFGEGQAIVTPKILKAEIIAAAAEWEEAGLIQNIDDFKQNLIVEINANDKTRVDVMMPPTLVGQFQIAAFQIAFK